jgi:hypothetical protein
LRVEEPGAVCTPRVIVTTSDLAAARDKIAKLEHDNEQLSRYTFDEFVLYKKRRNEQFELHEKAMATARAEIAELIIKLEKAGSVPKAKAAAAQYLAIVKCCSTTCGYEWPLADGGTLEDGAECPYCDGPLNVRSVQR